MSFGENHVWRFSPGDDIAWANPAHDDSEWVDKAPFGLTEPLPDSLWYKGHGWFRTRFKADSTKEEQKLVSVFLHLGGCGSLPGWKTGEYVWYFFNGFFMGGHIHPIHREGCR